MSPSKRGNLPVADDALMANLGGGWAGIVGLKKTKNAWKPLGKWSSARGEEEELFPGAGFGMEAGGAGFGWGGAAAGMAGMDNGWGNLWGGVGGGAAMDAAGGAAWGSSGGPRPNYAVTK